ncbi:MAG: peptidylprolyl isomerase [Anaerolineae bacterium]
MPAGSPATAPDPTATSSPPSPTSERPLAARVNGESVYVSDFKRELEQYRASLEAQGVDLSSQEGQQKLADASRWILDLMIEQKLIEEAAEQAGVEVTADMVDEYMHAVAAESGGEQAFRAKLEAWGETYDDARREVRAQLVGMSMTERIVAGVPESAEQVHARHILVDTAAEAERIRVQVEAGADFVALAKAHSQDRSTRENGGDLGYFPRGILLASEVEEVAFSLQPGQFSEVITSAMGYHVVQVVERDPDRSIGLEDLQLLRERAVQEWVDGLWAQAEVDRIVDLAP